MEPWTHGREENRICREWDTKISLLGEQGIW